MQIRELVDSESLMNKPVLGCYFLNLFSVVSTFFLMQKQITPGARFVKLFYDRFSHKR